MILVKNLKLPHLVCSGCNWSKRTFGDILDTKKLSRLQKRWYLKGWKFEFFAKGLVHDFGHKFEVSSPSLLSFKLIKKSVRRHSWYKNPFLHYKNVDIIKLKNLHSLSSGYSIILVGNLKILWLDFSWPIWPQGPEEMCLSLEHQNPSKTSEKMGYFDRVTVSLHILYPANQETKKCVWQHL